MHIYLIYSSTESLLEWCEKLAFVQCKGSHSSAWDDVRRKFDRGEIKEDETVVFINGDCVPIKEQEAISESEKHLDDVEVLFICSNDRYVSLKKKDLMIGRALTYTAYITKVKTILTFKRRGITSKNIGFRTKIGFVDNIFRSHKVACTVTKLRVLNHMLSAHDELLHSRE